MSDYKIILFIIILNLVISSVYLIYMLLKGDRVKGFINFLFMILCPLIGPCYILISNLFYIIFFNKRNSQLDMSELSFSKKRVDIIMAENIEMAMDKVPLEEALVISDKHNVRKVVLEILKNNSDDTLKEMLKATEHNDSEVSHYAAAAISDVISVFKKTEKEFEKNTIANPSEENLMDHGEFIYSYLEKDILPRSEEIYYIKAYERIISEIEEKFHHRVTSDLYYKVIKLLLKIGDYDEALKWFEKSSVKEPKDLYYYKGALNIYYDLGDGEKFTATLNELKSSNLILDNEALELIRFYNYNG